MIKTGWNSELYRIILDKIFKEGKFLDEQIEKKDTLFLALR